MVFMVGSFCVVPWQRLHFLTQQMLLSFICQCNFSMRGNLAYRDVQTV
nr:MAG TPA: hypothetical protein [Caudoviricetes sp.]